MRKLKVGVSELSPLVFKTKKGFSGFEIELWELIAKKLKLKFVYEKTSFKNLLTSVKKERFDVGMAGITRNEKREKDLNFSHKTMDSGLGVMISKKEKENVFKFFWNIFLNSYKKLLSLFGIFLILGFIFSNLIWFVERGSGTFNSKYSYGIFEAFWWLVITISTVGYGDIVPISILGKVLSIFFILTGLSFLGIYVAEVTSLLTLNRARYKINSYHDLIGKKVATKKDTIAVDILNKLGAEVKTVKEIEDAHAMLKRGEVDAVVFDSLILQHKIKSEDNKEVFSIVDIFNHHTYGFAFPNGSKIRDKVNEVILEISDSGEYQKIYKKWFGNINKFKI